MSRPLGAIVDALGGQLVGNPSLEILRLAPLATATSCELSFVAQARYASQIATTAAGALIVPPALQEAAAARGACVVWWPHGALNRAIRPGSPSRLLPGNSP